MLQVWLPTGSQRVDQVEHRSQVLGLCAQAAGLLIRVHTHLTFQLSAPRLLIRVCTTRASGVGAQAADQGKHTHGCFVPVCPLSWATDLGAHWSTALGLCARAGGLLIRVHTTRGFRCGSSEH